jgi:hypothetical protein
MKFKIIEYQKGFEKPLWRQIRLRATIFVWDIQIKRCQKMIDKQWKFNNPTPITAARTAARLIEQKINLLRLEGVEIDFVWEAKHWKVYDWLMKIQEKEWNE